jgi:hypothetical protein
MRLPLLLAHKKNSKDVLLVSLVSGASAGFYKQAHRGLLLIFLHCSSTLRERGQVCEHGQTMTLAHEIRWCRFVRPLTVSSGRVWHTDSGFFRNRAKKTRLVTKFQATV